MAIHSFPTASQRLSLTSAQRDLLRHALQSGWKKADGDFARRQAIRELCSVGRDSKQRPEQMVIAFKESLVEAADEARLPYGPERREVLARMVSVFIEELYGFRIIKSDREEQAHEERI